MKQRDVALSLLDEHGTTYAEQAGITLRDKPSPLFQLLVLAVLSSAPIAADVAVATARELFTSGWRTPARMRHTTWQERVHALGRGGYRRYDESTATRLDEVAQHVESACRGDLRRLRTEADDDVTALRARLQDVPGLGPVGADIFCREVQEVWPTVRPFFDDRSLEGARVSGLPQEHDRLAALVAEEQLARFAAGLARVGIAARRGRGGTKGDT